MDTIDITTGQQVVITYEVAEVRDRIMALAVDILLLLLLYAGISFLAVQLLQVEFDSNGLQWTLFLLLSFYSLLFELAFNGQTPGKRALGIQVIHLHGLEVSMMSYLLRWVMRPVDIWLCLGSVAIIFIIAGGKGQRLGDILAGTAVVRLGNKQHITFSQIEKLKDSQNHQPKYPGVALFEETDVLVMKELMDRASRFRNQAHREVLVQVTDKLAARLNLPAAPPDRIGFLKDLIQDYVALSR